MLLKSTAAHVPIDVVMPEILGTLARSERTVISAPPGAGKTTRVPLALADEAWCAKKKIIMLEPRRLAARRAAEYMASLLGEEAGETVGYTVRGERAVSPRTKIEVVTEGILTRMLQADPALEDTSCIIFDEFHERSIHADLGLALALDVQENLRSDLKLVVMSATLDIASISELLGPDAAVVKSEGRSFPVETRYLRFAPEKPVTALTADAVVSMLREHEEGDLLVFLPGRGEIRAVESMLYERKLNEDVRVHMLYGEASVEAQRAALAPAPAGTRKVILSTSVAETSLTIDGVRVVIDAGRARMSQFDARRGMSGLVTVPVSKAAADQRRGRAGRQAPGYCLRLWTESEHENLSAYAQPEIKTADLAPLALDLAAWGDATGEHLKFIDPPPAHHLSQARSLLTMLGALDARSGAITPHGRRMNTLPVHPRLAHMILRGTELGAADRACTIAALLDERDLFAGRADRDIDLALRLEALSGPRSRTVQSSSAAIERITQQARRLGQMIARMNPSTEKKTMSHAHHAVTEGLLLALAYPDRVARRRTVSQGESTRYLTSNGTTAELPKGSLLARSEFLAIGETDARESGTSRILLASPLTEDEIEAHLTDSITEEEEIFWNAQEEAVTSRMVTRLGAVILSERTLHEASPRIEQAMLEGVREMGLDALPWSEEARTLCERAEWARAHATEAAEIPKMDRETLALSIEEWLAPFLSGIRRRAQLGRLDLPMILRTRLGYEAVTMLDRIAPSHIALKTGTRTAIDYTADPPVLAVRLQELFGQTDSPAINQGRTRLLLHILSPARRPLAVTQDLVSFWTKLYPELRTQLRARYPKHVWPDDPLSARPTNKTKRFQPPQG